MSLFGRTVHEVGSVAATEESADTVAKLPTCTQRRYGVASLRMTGNHMHTAYIALGSNLGNRLTNLKAALAALTPQMAVVAKSHIYETPPWGYTEQSAFLNQAVKVETYLEPEPLLRHLKRLEVALGRAPGFQNGPRLIDLDLLFFDDLVLETNGLILPHPRLHERAFVLVPLNDIVPELIHPALKKTVRELLTGCDTSGIQLVK